CILISFLLYFSFYCSAHPPHLHSFPTRRSSDLGMPVNVEFVSTNPTGPVHAGGGRWAAYGDSLCKLLERCGYAPHREFYLNDRRSEEHTSELQSPDHLVCRLLLEKKKEATTH